MKVQDWIVSVRYCPEGNDDLRRFAVIGPARASTVEAALHLAGAPEPLRAEIRANKIVRMFVEGALDPDASGYYTSSCSPEAKAPWVICIGSIQEVIS